MAKKTKKPKPVARVLHLAMAKHEAFATSLDSNPIVRQKLAERLARTINERKSIPIAVLHLVAQLLEEYE